MRSYQSIERLVSLELYQTAAGVPSSVNIIIDVLAPSDQYLSCDFYPSKKKVEYNFFFKKNVKMLNNEIIVILRLTVLFPVYS